MDLGYFSQSRRRFWSWLLLPVVVIVLVYTSVRIYADSTTRALESRHELLAVIPRMERKIDEARNLMGDINANAEDGPGAMESVSSALHVAATESGFTIDSLATDTGRVVAPGRPPSAVKFKVKGEGSLLALMRFSHTIHLEQKVLSANMVRLALKEFRADPYYQAEFSFTFQDIKL